MRSAFFTLLLLLCLTTTAGAEEINEKAYRGWGFLAHHLKQRGMSEATVRRIFLDKRMPKFSLVPFAVVPKEPKRYYTKFFKPSRLKGTSSYLRRYRTSFREAERKHGIPQEMIVVILLVESDLGASTGKYRILPRLARVANAGSPWNIEENYKRLIEDGEEVSKEEVALRGKYLTDLFVPEIEATVRIARERGFSPFVMKGSYAGAFGFAQFLPTSFEQFAQDGNKDGKISLFHHPDAIHSIAAFLAHHRDGEENSEEALRAAIFQYNKSEPYVETVMELSRRLGVTFVTPKANNPQKEAGSS